jgi:hypothetical protein
MSATKTGLRHATRERRQNAGRSFLAALHATWLHRFATLDAATKPALRSMCRHSRKGRTASKCHRETPMSAFWLHPAV